MISPDLLFLALAGIAFLGFTLDALFHRLRITSILPLMLLGLLLLASGILPAGTIARLTSLAPYLTALTIAFILFAVGLEIRFSELQRVLGRASAFAFGVQTTTGVALGLLAFLTVHWSLLISFVFGFALSGPSSVAVPTLVRVARMPPDMRTTLLYEAVVSDVLQLLVPLTLLGFLVAGVVTPVEIATTFAWTIAGSAAAGVAAALLWLWILDRMRRYSAGYTWTLTVTMVLATYGAADAAKLSAAIVIFIFGLTLANASLFDRTATITPEGLASAVRSRLYDLRERIGISTRGLDMAHILEVQREVAFFASAFFFVYIGLLFEFGSLNLLLAGVAIASAGIMLALRLAWSPVLERFLDPEPSTHRVQQSLLVFNISRGLSPAVVATIPATLGLVIPGFLDSIFLAILASTVLSTLGIFVLYRAAPPAGTMVRSPGPAPARGPVPPAPVLPGTERAGPAPLARTGEPSPPPAPDPPPLPNAALRRP